MNGVVRPYQYILTDEQVLTIKKVLGIDPIGYEVTVDFSSSNTAGNYQTVIRKKSMVNVTYGNTTLAGLL